jgi:ribosomal protein S27AE
MWQAGKRSATPAAAVPAAVLELVGRHLGVPASEVRVASASRPSALAEREAFAGRITCANANGVSASVFVSPRGNVYADAGDGANIATLLVERALSPARADSFSDWFAVGGALHNIDSSLFDVWDRFSRQSEGKYPGRDKLMTRWCQFNAAHSLGTLVFMARDDNPEETRAILRGNRSLLLGQLRSKGVEGILKAPSTPSPPPDGEATASPVRKTSVHKTVVALERRVLRAVLGDTASEPVIATGATSWNGAWCAPSGRRCAHGAVHFGETTFETFVAATRACPRPGCGGLVGGGFWRDRNTCGKCRRVDAPMPDSPSPCGGLVGTKKPPMVLYELCHGCGVQSEPMFVGRMNAVPAKKASLPTAMGVYAAAVDKRSPSWELTPCPPFNTSRHTFTALFTVTECGRYVHKDGHRRLLGVTSGGDVLLGVKESNKPAQTPYAWTSVAHWFRKALAAWFSEEHAAVVARLPAPRTTQAGVLTWTLPCCAVAGQCGRVKCRTVTDEPWRYLRQLRAHGVNAD